MSFVSKLGSAMISTTKVAAYQASKHSPEILVGAGIAMGVGATVLACKATTQLEPVVDDIQSVFDDVHEAHESGECTDGQHVRNLMRAYAYGVKEVGKLYFLPFTLGMASIASILGGHNILRKRHIALVAAYSSLEKSYDQLYSRVANEFSPKAADNFANNVSAQDKKVDGKDKTIEIQEGDVLGKYEWIYGPECTTWHENAFFGEQRIMSQMDEANRHIILKKDNTLTVAEVLKDWGELDIPAEFFAYGWHMPWDHHATTAEPYIKWTYEPIYRIYDDKPVLCWKVNFNCDGYIWDKLWKKGTF